MPLIPLELRKICFLEELSFMNIYPADFVSYSKTRISGGFWRTRANRHVRASFGQGRGDARAREHGRRSDPGRAGARPGAFRRKSAVPCPEFSPTSAYHAGFGVLRLQRLPDSPRDSEPASPAAPEIRTFGLISESGRGSIVRVNLLA